MPNRREFVSLAAFAGAAVLVNAQTTQTAPAAQNAAPPKTPALDRDMVQGGRFDIFVAAMLGKLDIVKNALAVFPNLAQSKGPHGIPLIMHAKKGGENAAEVVAYLESLTQQLTV